MPEDEGSTRFFLTRAKNSVSFCNATRALSVSHISETTTTTTLHWLSECDGSRFEAGEEKKPTSVICFFHRLLIVLKTAEPMLGPRSHPMAAKPMTIRPNVTKGSSGTWETTGSMTPVVRTAPPAVALAPSIAILKASCQRRRVLRSWKKEFQSRRSPPSEEDAAPAPEEAEGAVDAQRTATRERTDEVGVVGPWRKATRETELVIMLSCRDGDWTWKHVRGIMAAGLPLVFAVLAKEAARKAPCTPWPARQKRIAIVDVVGVSIMAILLGAREAKSACASNLSGGGVIECESGDCKQKLGGRCGAWSDR